MINVELSSIWSSVSLPDLLSGEKDLFDAHMQLCDGTRVGPDFLGWISASENAMAKIIHTLRTSADSIRGACDILVAISSGSAGAAAEASVALLQQNQNDGPQILFTGSDLSTDAWLQLSQRLSNKEFSLLLLQSEKQTLESSVSFRALRWLAERRYGADARHRIYICAPEGSAGANMAVDAGYTLICQPDCLGAADSALSPAALLPLCVAGVEPLDVLEGAKQAKQDYDLRAFENPVWMYAGARHALEYRGRRAELLCVFEPRLSSFGAWWAQRTAGCCLREGYGLMPIPLQLPKQLELLDGLMLPSAPGAFETVLRVPLQHQKVNVEMDWKDYDGLAYLDGRSLSDLDEACCEAVIQTHTSADVPLIVLETGSMNPGQYGELVYFMELSAALSAAADGLSPFDFRASLPSRQTLLQLLGGCS